MNVNISNFMEDRKANTEEAPYMEMKTSFGNKENIKPANKKQPSHPKQTKEESFGLSLPLGEEYERKKQKLKQELRLDYRHFMSEKKNQIIADPLPQSHMLSLPIKERRSAKEKLQDERNKEYNMFLRGQEGAQKIGKTSTTLQALERDRFGSITPKYPVGSLEVQAQKASQSPENTVFSKRDVATLTEPISGVPKLSRPRRRWGETPDRWGGPNRDHTSSDEEIELLEKERHKNVQEDTGKTRRGGKYDNSSHSLQAPTPAQSRSVNKQNMTEFATGLMIGATEGIEASQRRKERYRLELLQQIAEQQKNKRKEKELELRVAATGAVDPEKKPNRIKQFGAVTQEREGRRMDVSYHPGLGLEEFRADSARWLKEERSLQPPKETAPPERPRAAFQSPSLDHSTVLSQLANTPGLGLEAGAGFGANDTTSLTEDNHRSLARTLGEIVAPRITGARPPLGPSLADSYQTHDNAHYYYGARNPLDPNLAYYGPAVDQQALIPPEAQWPVLQPPSGGLTQAISHAGVVPSGPAFFPPERLQQAKESAVSYQEALKQQIQERQQRRHREKVEKELYDAKIKAEMKAYEPWGRAGGGAPLRDYHGNLISDLKQMHKTNVEAYDSGGRVARIPVPETLPRASKPAGFCSSQPSVQARGNLFNELPTPQQLHDQENYKDCLKQQIEEKRRKEAEERERCRLEEEKEERRLAEQRARIQREYEEEQERKRRKEKEQMAKNEELVRQAEGRRKEAEKMRKEAEEKENLALRKKQEREKQTHLEEVHRAPSPPLPALQKKLRQQTPRPPSVESHRSSATLSMRSMSAPHSPPVPARRNEIRATEEKHTVIRELSALRRQLRSEQRRLEGELMQSNRNDHTPPVHSRPREHIPEDVFEVARLRKQVHIRRPASHTTAAVNMQNLQEFNRPKYRDGASREEVRQAYLDSPSDNHSLDIQQQALLRQQQRTINSLRRGRAAGYFDMVSSGQRHHNEQRLNSAEDPGRHLLLDSESAFINPSDDAFLLRSRRDQRARPAVRKADMSEDVVNGYARPDRSPDSQSLHSITSTEIERLRERTKNKMTSLNNMREHDWRSGQVSAEEGEELWPQTPPSTDRRVSIDTIATDTWLRPSSSETLKRFMSGRRPSSQNHVGQDWEGPSTYHG
ncbi:centrosome and spindle pole-associated protein 1-like isoform X1 [Sinocyclocheilus grahami]|uniref:centrosome and spindle pole-associated protein 1-like isoform X1 n=1 Tax=Sinocyclocheilus grahami TaxID=75366 RepID=UPI0007AC9CCF|nr:PREDICTED: centrosome and spindle pole-associated protein 1-like isoform X1 [Sinocyclocheilus grahami]